MTDTIQGIVFDKDGTLFDFDATWAPVTAQMIAMECDSDPGRMQALAEVLGFDLDRIRFRPGSLVIASTADVVEDAVLPFTKDQDRTALRDRMRAGTGAAKQVPVTDLHTLFSDLRVRGHALGIATNDSIDPALANLEDAGVRSAFDFIAGFDSGYGSKPAPGQLHGFCAALDLSPGACLMVGDSLHDLHAGRAAGMRTVGVLTGPAPQAELAPFADVVLDSIAGLPDWLDTQRSA